MMMEKLEGFFGRKAAEYSAKYEENCEERVAAHYGFFEGAKFEHDRLTRWNDAKVILPDYYQVVEVKYRSSGLLRISTAWMAPGDSGGYVWTIEATTRRINAANIIGWRNIEQ